MVRRRSLMALTFVLPNKIQFYTFMVIVAVISIVPIVYSYLEFKKKSKISNKIKTLLLISKTEIR